MREIKFRAWDNLNKCWADWLRVWKDAECDADNDYDFKQLALYVDKEGHVLEHTFEHGICDTNLELQGKPRYTLVQFTGLHDKNGKEIYEGDIVQCGKNKAEIRWDGIKLRPFDYISGLDFVHGIKPIWTQDTLVVGSIYENPDFLKEQP